MFFFAGLPLRVLCQGCFRKAVVGRP